MEYLNAFAIYLAMVVIFYITGQKFFDLNGLDRSDLRLFPNMFFLWPLLIPAGIGNIDNKERRDEVAIGSGSVWFFCGLGFYKVLNFQMPEWKFFLYYALTTFGLLVVGTIIVFLLYLRSRTKSDGTEEEDNYEYEQ
jgi:hypothetical protein